MKNPNSPDTLAIWISALCRGDHDPLAAWLSSKTWQILVTSSICITIGCGFYGFSIGIWRGYEMAFYVALKLPILIFCTLLLNCLINGLLAILLNSGISILKSLQLLLTSFATMSIILASLSPISLALSLYAPSPEAINAKQFHSFALIFHTIFIAYSGVVSNQALRKLLIHCSLNARAANHTFYAWLMGNLFVGAQLSWVLRPFFGSPGLSVSFLRDDPFTGNFYETIWTTILFLFSN